MGKSSANGSATRFQVCFWRFLTCVARPRVSRYSSVASLTATAIGALIVIGMAVLYQLSPLYVVYAVGAAGMIWLFHLDNIQRLLAGSERQIEWRR